MITSVSVPQTSFCSGRDVLCTAQPGEVVVHINTFKSKGQIADLIEALYRATEEAKLGEKL